jgi:EmrB/QacA subfamily drug resistance transporter
VTTGSPATEAGTQIDRSTVGLRSTRGPILLSLMVANSLVALDSTIIATAVPSIVGSLGGLAQFPWLFSIYLLAQAVSIPIYGKLADQFGRKPIILWGIGLFFLGSIAAGCAWSMPMLIACRALQGLGAGAVQPMSLTIVSDIYSLRERAKVQGYMASVWGASSIIGPALGGVFAEWVSWRWIFFVNIPLCGVATWLLIVRFKEQVHRQRHKIDVGGALLLTGGCTLLILGLLEGGQAWAWDSAVGIGIFVAGAACLVGFVAVERKATEPVLPLWVFRSRLVVCAAVVSLVVGAVTLGLSSYVPTFAQTSLGVGPLTAGFALGVLTLGWPLAASTAGRLYLRFGFRATTLLGGTLVLIGTSLLLTLGLDSSILQVGGYCFVIGVGLGWSANPALIAAQTSVGWSERGVITGTNMFARSMGSALGVALFGAVANAILDGTETAASMAHATHAVFLMVLGAAVLMLLFAPGLPRMVTPPS